MGVMMEISSNICPDILNSVDESILKNNILADPSIKYYKHKYCTKIVGVDERIYQRISFHSNKICLLSLAEDHPIITDDKEIIKIDCQVSNLNRLNNAVSGKGKKGAQKLHPHSPICYIECKGGEKYTVYSCVEGKLVEINKRLIDNPNLLKSHPISKGYIALIMPMLSKSQTFIDIMLTSGDYLANK